MNYAADSQERARRRKSAWNLLLIPAVVLPFVAGWSGVVFALDVVHRWIHPGERLFGATGIGPILTVVGVMFAMLLPALITGNLLVRKIVPAARDLNREAAAVPGTSFHDAQRSLVRMAAFAVTVGMAIAAGGTVLPWK